MTSADVRARARLWVQVSSARIQHRDEVGRQAKGGKPFAHFDRRQYLVRQFMFPGASQRSRYDHPFERADHQSASNLHEWAAARILQLSPQLVGAPDERHVERVLKVGLADDATVTVRGSECMP